MRNRAGMKRVVLSGVGVEIPEASISNEELVDSFNVWVDRENATRCLNGAPLLQKSDSDFIVYASGVRNRHVLVRDGILDPAEIGGGAYPGWLVRQSRSCLCSAVRPAWS